MPSNTTAAWLPPRQLTGEGMPRRVGVEIELAGLSPETITGCIRKLYGGQLHRCTAVEYRVENTGFGDFKLELDASYIKALVEKHGDGDSEDDSLAGITVGLVAKAAEQLVPWEIVSPPVDMVHLQSLEELVAELREQGALGTRNAIHYAFGVHLNPELPTLDATTILAYIRAYFCLYDWIVEQEQVDVARKLTTYIRHFGKQYIALVMDRDYRPSQARLIDDYLSCNPTRNRSLDLLPLFAHLDKSRVISAVDDPRIKARPTFHYRIPNCDIDNPGWNLGVPWKLWLEVEKLANDPARLTKIGSEYQQELTSLTYPLSGRWSQRVADLLEVAR